MHVAGVGVGYGAVDSCHDLLSEAFLVLGFKRMLQASHLVQNSAQRPNVRLLVVRPPAPQLRRHVVGSADLRRCETGLGNFCDAEIAKFNSAPGCQKDVCSLEIAVDDAALVQRGSAHQCLNEEAPDEVLVHQLLAADVALDLGTNIAEASKFSHDIKLVAVKKSVVVSDGVRVLDGGEQTHFIKSVVSLALIHGFDLQFFQSVFLSI